ncbi:MAG: transposase, partial [Clostridiales bacterium]|nr:transposase [Clostridiales bacterium]
MFLQRCIHRRRDQFFHLFRNSIATPSLVSGFVNGKYVNGMPIHRIEQELKRNGVNISKQTISNWTIDAAERYLLPLYDRMQEELLTLHVNQCDETPVQVIKDGRSPGSKSY